MVNCKELKNKIKFTKSQTVFYYHHVSAILHMSVIKYFLKISFVSQSFKQLLWLLLSFKTIYLSTQLILITHGSLFYEVTENIE